MLLKLPRGRDRAGLTPDMRALVEGVTHDQGLLRDRVSRLTGSQGLARLRGALTAARAAVAAEHAAEPAVDGVAGGAGPHPGANASRGDADDSSFPPLGTDTPPSLGPCTPDARAPGRSALLRAGLRPRALFPAESATGAIIAAPLSGTAGGSGLVENRIEARGGAGRAAPEGADVKLRMVWELLHDPRWQLPSSDVEAHWKDALGESAVMQVQLHSKTSNFAQAIIYPESVSRTQHQRHQLNI